MRTQSLFNFNCESRRFIFVRPWAVCFMALFVVGISIISGQTQLRPTRKSESAKAFPFIARITGNDVQIRSGPGTNFYRCGKLNQGDKVEVVAQKGGWSQIVPPPGSFSWIAMQYVALKMNDPTVAVVTGDNVAVYAGSDFVEPMHSTSKQVTLKRGTSVRLLNEEKDGYFKIIPPAKSYLWVSGLYVERITKPKPAVVEPLRSVTVLPTPIQDSNQPDPKPAHVKPSIEPAVVTGRPEPEKSKQLKAYYVIQEKVKAEKNKPLSEQDYTALKLELKRLAPPEGSGDVARYASFLLKQIGRYELAKQVRIAIDTQAKELKNVQEQIEIAENEGIKDKKRLGKYAVLGIFEGSNIYNSSYGKRYRIKDEKGATRCYAEPAGDLVGQDLQAYIGKKVGLVGEVKSFPAVSGALVVFTEIAVLP